MITEQVVPEQGVPEASSAVSRWQIAVIGAVAVLAAGIGLVLGLTVLPGRGTSPLGTSASYVPAGAFMYVEARLDLPGGQRDSLRAVLERFPGINADDLLTDAVADTLDETLAGSGLPVDYSTDIAPWFDGRVAVALLNYPISLDLVAPGDLPSTAAMFGVHDVEAAQQLTDTLRQEISATGPTFSRSDHAGITIWSIDVDLPAGQGFAYALTGDQLLLANGRTVIETLLDVHAGSDSLAQRDELRDLSLHLPPEWVGVATIDVEAMLDQMRGGLEASDPALAEWMGVYLDAVPSLVVSTIGFENDAIRMGSVTPLPNGGVTPSNAQRDLAASVPADAIFFADGANVGPRLTQMVTGVRAALGAGAGGTEALMQLDQVEAALGGDLEDFVSWIGSGAMAIGWNGAQPYGGLVLEASDPDAARQRLGQLRALAELASLDPSVQVDVSTAQLDGVEVTTFTVTSPQSDAGMWHVGDIVLQYALDGDTVLIGFGDEFVARALALEPGGSLADHDRFIGAVDRFGGGDNAGTFFVDLVALREAIEAAATDTIGPDYESKVKPNLEPLDYLAGVTRVEGDAIISSFGLVLQP